MSLPNYEPEDLHLTPDEMREPTWAERDTATQDFLFGMLARKCKVVGHPVRLQIIELLESNEVSVDALADQLEIRPSEVSHHLTYLRRENMVTVRPLGRARLYRLHDRRMLSLLDQV